MNISDIMKHLAATSYRQKKMLVSRLGNVFDFNHQEFIVDFFGLKYPGHTLNFIDGYVYFFGSYEEGVLLKIKQILELHPEKSFIDIGANVGHHSLFASLYAKQVYAFEPYSKVRAKLDEKIALNELTNIKVFPLGLSDKDETLDFYEPLESNLGTGSFLPGTGEINTFRGLQLDLKLASSFIEQEAINSIGLIKIDTEGFEPQVLKGLLPILASQRPMIILEYGATTHQELEKFPEVKKFLIDHYHMQLFADPNHPDENFVDFNFQLFGNVLLTPL